MMKVTDSLTADALLFLARRADETARNRRVKTERLVKRLDPDGVNLVTFKFPHNDVEWRLYIMAKLRGTQSPATFWLDASFDDYEQAIVQSEALPRR